LQRFSQLVLVNIKTTELHQPDIAASCAIPEPILPAPTTPVIIRL
jgi:hypothetical protein